MKEEQLKILLREIVRHIVNELSTMDMKKLADTNPELDSSVPPEDAMTSAEKARIQQQDLKQKRDDIKQKTGELDSEKKKMEFQKREIDQTKRFKIPSINKDLQKLKGANI